MHLKIYLFIFVTIIFFIPCVSAQSHSSDELFQQARTIAFDQKDYQKAILFAKQALVKSPDYTDVSTFLGRLYTWSDQPDSAAITFAGILSKHPDYEDAAVAYGSLLHWNNNNDKALQLCNAGLTYHAQSKNLLLLKARILNAMRNFYEATTVLQILLKIDPNNTAARSLADRIKDYSIKNKVGISYDFLKFDKQFDAPWHLTGIDYTRQTGLGSVTARLNYANRFSTSGTQFEIDAYPHISQTLYAYLSGGYSNNISVFPEYRAGFSLYATLPASFEAEGGFRFLNFGSPTWIYTASISKYYKSYWFNFRTFLTPSNSAVSQSYLLNFRYYFGGTDDYLSFGMGTGVSPDDPLNNILFNTGSIYRLRSNNISGGYRHAFKTFNVIYFNASMNNQEYRLNTYGNQLNFGVGYQRKF